MWQPATDFLEVRLAAQHFLDRCDFAVRRLSGGGAPGVERKHLQRPSHWDRLHGRTGYSGNMGRKNFNCGGALMKKIAEVEEAKSIMTEAQDWGIWRWLTEKRKVRLAADNCNDALARAEKKTIESWPDEMRAAYEELVAQDVGGKKRHAKKIDADVVEMVRKIKEALDHAETVRLDAEDIFDRADRALSTSMAKQGTVRAIEAWELREKAIRKAESAGKAKATA